MMVMVLEEEGEEGEKKKYEKWTREIWILPVW